MRPRIRFAHLAALAAAVALLFAAGGCFAGQNLLSALGATTHAVSGAVANAAFNQPSGIAFRPAGELYVTDNYDNVVRKGTLAGVVTKVLGTPNLVGGDANGIGGNTQVKNSQGLIFDLQGTMYVADTTNELLRKGQ